MSKLTENIKCPLCGGKVQLLSISISHSPHKYMRHFKLVCHKCGLTSREAAILVTIDNDGEVVIRKDVFNELLKEWGG